MNQSNDTQVARPPKATPERASVSPLVDVYENPDELLLVADVPGANASGVRVHLERGQLTLEARRADAPGGSAVLREVQPRDYRRVFSVPDGIDAAKIEATLAAGVLTVRLPKREAVKARTIQVKAG